MSPTQLEKLRGRVYPLNSLVYNSISLASTVSDLLDRPCDAFGLEALRMAEPLLHETAAAVTLLLKAHTQPPAAAPPASPARPPC